MTERTHYREFEILVPAGRKIYLVLADGIVATWQRTLKTPGESYEVQTFAVPKTQPIDRIQIEFEP